MTAEMIGLVVGLILTLAVYSYLIGDNPLYQLAVHILAGVAAGYSLVIITQEVLWPVAQEIQTSSTNGRATLWLIPIVLALLLLLKRLPAVAWLGNSSVAVMVGVGAAVALVGALLGTLLPQLTAVSDTPQTIPFQPLIVAFLTIVTLLSFQFTRRLDEDGELVTPRWLQGVRAVGNLVLMVTFGFLFATVLNSSLTLLVERVAYFINELT